MDVLISFAAFVLAIGVLVTVHEWGHFRMARQVGIKVLRFSIGFGRPLKRWVGADGTEFVVAAVPLGGYVRMLDERDGDVPVAELGQAFNRQSILARAAVVSAGPLANFVFAIAAFWIMLMVGVPGLRPLLGTVAPGSAADVAGLTVEDEILAVAGVATPTWEAASLAMLDGVLAGDDELRLTVADPAGARREVALPVRDATSLTEPGALLQGLGLTPWRPRLPAVLGELTPEGAAARAGLESGDEILALDGRPVADWIALVEQVRARGGQTVSLEVRRGDERLVREVALTAEAEGEIKVGRLGARVEVPTGLFERLRATQQFGVLEALPAAISRTWDLSVLTLRMLWRMLTGEASLANISGPINIAQYAGVTATIGPVAFLGFLAVISVSLGVLNLLPIPILDGGHLAFLTVEAVKGSPVSARTEAMGQQVGLVLLVMLMGFAFYNDIARLWP
jgi:regulator of sigma E protease